ncbi:MAG TPA: DUF2059 domain-containing protein [Rhizomicrobium sp.]|jgi:hypothetical protein
MKRLSAAVLIFSLWGVPAVAHSDLPSPDPEKVAIGGEIYDLYADKQDIQGRTRAIAQAALKMESDSLKNKPDSITTSADSATANLIMGSVAKVVEDMRPTMRRAYAEAYARHFSMDELKEIKAFYQSAAGQELLTEQPKISREVIPEITPEIISRLGPIINQNAHSTTEPGK